MVQAGDYFFGCAGAAGLPLLYAAEYLPLVLRLLRSSATASAYLVTALSVPAR